MDEFRAKQEQLEEEFNRNNPVAAVVRDESTAESNESDAQEEAIRRKILVAALPYVNTLGWTKEAISKGAESIGYPGVVHGIFPRGPIELIEHFYGDCNERLLEFMRAETKNEYKVQNAKEFVVKAVQMRLQMLVPHMSNWPQAIAIMSLPPNAVRSLANLLTLVDDICYYSGDRAVDFGWYTRRVGLAGIMKMTELYMLQDKSVDQQDTWKFLERRMDDAVLMNKLLEQSDDVTQNMQRAVGSVFTTARNIMGLNFDKR